MKRINKLWIRFLVVFLIHIAIKSFDLSFPKGPFELNWRSLCFSVGFVVYGMLIWYLAEKFDRFLNTKIDNFEGDRKKSLLLTFFHSLFGYTLTLSINLIYRLSDQYIFDHTELWENVYWFNPELTISLTIIYLLIYGFDNYARMHTKLQERKLKEEQLKKENITAQYKALKAQIEPHFLFNSLSVLSSLVYEDADLSADFIVKLSKTLRYIIEKNQTNLVKLTDELNFLEAYFFLIKTRLEDGVSLDIKLEDSFIEKTYIPPVTLQLLIENAINHNSYNPDKPLHIVIEKKDDLLMVRNNLNKRELLKQSTKQGLKNIAKRYKLISQEEVEIQKTETEFIVKLPVLNNSHYESFNI